MDKESKKNYGVTQQQGIGTVQIADDVIAVIVGIAATEVEGIAALGDNITNELMSKVGIKNINKGVKVAINDSHVDVEVSLTVGYGYNIPATCAKVQEKIKMPLVVLSRLHSLQLENLTFLRPRMAAKPRMSFALSR